MGDANQSTPPKGWDSIKKHCIEHKLDVALWFTRLFTITFTLNYFIPIFGNPYSAYHRALLANAATSALRLHQRLPRVSLSAEFFNQLWNEDSAHYLLFSLIFIYSTPVALALLPVFLFSLIHFASYSLTLLDALGQNSWWGARILISLVEFQSRNILRLISFAEIFLMPLCIVLLILGRTGLLTPFIYYRFLARRYVSRRNPYTRNMFRELRVYTEAIANKESIPPFIRNALHSGIAFTCKIAPQEQAAS
ncbi:unnamed protein product [Bemisia tabaci]|uniref:Krueppel homolog 2 n=1 Tax=Bemisia tabaci TaxID=7038 RepID=A0A9P0CF73_BEMTA|nr:PREDICTED: Krueppel homolog 2 [Bemisia tabaci]CAH0769700.1 unnamed protein product [Bemisia tabaci]